MSLSLDAMTWRATIEVLMNFGAILYFLAALILLGAAVACTAAAAATAAGPDRRRGEGRARLMTVLLPALAYAALGAAPASPQVVPTIEPRFTRIFGSDTLDVGGGALSPDGRWILFSVYEGGGSRSNLYTVPAAGGEPRRLTAGDHMDDGPVWFPDSDRVAFRSDRPGIWAVMTVPVDPSTGGPAGPIRQVTLESSQAYLDVSPDGGWISYTPAREEDGRRVVRVVPSTGGAARTVSQDATSVAVWSPEGDALYYAVTGAGAGGRDWALVRAGIEEAGIDTVFTWPGMLLLSRTPNTRYLLRAVDPPFPADMNQSITWELATLQGRALARFKLPPRMWPSRFVRDEIAFLAARTEEQGVLQVLPVDGGGARTLNRGNSVDEPVAWTPSGNALLVRTQLNGESVALLAPVEGGAMVQVPLPMRSVFGEPSARAGFRPAFSADGGHLLYGSADDESGLWSLHLLDVADGSSRTVADPAVPLSVRGRGGVPYRDGDAALWVEPAADGYVLRTATGENSARTLRSFRAPAEDGAWLTQGSNEFTIAVHGERVLFVEQGDSAARLLLAHPGDAAPREILELPGFLAEASWSHDGRRIAGIHYGSREIPSARGVFLDISPSGQVVGEPRYVGDTMVAYWSLAWLPDDRGTLAIGMDAEVWFLPAGPGEGAARLTADDAGEIWDFLLAPDGRHIAYGTRIPRGGSIWRVDLDVPPARPSAQRGHEDGKRRVP